MKKYKVLKMMTRRSENMKVYNIGDIVELSNEYAEPLLKDKFVETIEIEKTKKK